MLPGISGVGGFMGGSVAAPGDWTITIAAGETSSDLTDYPVYLRLADMPGEFWSNVAAGGANIRVKQGGSNIPFDIVSIDTGADTGHLFFKASTLSSGSDNTFTLDLSGPGFVPVGAANGRNAVWSAFDWVCMGESASTFIDRTGGANGVLASGTLGTNSVIDMGGGGGLDCDLDEINFTGRPNRKTFTLAVTAAPDVVPISRTMAALSYRNAASGATNNRVQIGIDNSTVNDNFDSWDSLQGWINTSQGGEEIPVAGSPRRVHVVYNTTVSRACYISGVLGATDLVITENTNWDTYTIGSEDTSRANTWDGKIAYLYSRPEDVGAAYIAAEYSNLSNPAGFYSIA